jgi:hypothetical protein
MGNYENGADTGDDTSYSLIKKKFEGEQAQKLLSDN